MPRQTVPTEAYESTIGVDKWMETKMAKETKAVESVNLTCSSCSSYYFEGPFLYGAITDDGEFHPEPKRTQYKCLGCHTLQPVSAMRPRDTLGAPL